MGDFNAGWIYHHWQKDSSTLVKTCHFFAVGIPVDLMKIETIFLTRGVTIVKLTKMSDSMGRCAILWVLIMTMLSSGICAVYVLHDSNENGDSAQGGKSWYSGNALLPSDGRHTPHRHRHPHHPGSRNHQVAGVKDTYGMFVDYTPLLLSVTLAEPLGHAGQFTFGWRVQISEKFHCEQITVLISHA